jgi:hypothetical protein
MYYWETLNQQDNAAGGVWMTKLKSEPIDTPWTDLSIKLSPTQYKTANKRLFTLPGTAYQLTAQGEAPGDYTAINKAAEIDAQKNTDALNARLKKFNDDFAKRGKGKSIDITKLKPIEAGVSSAMEPTIIRKDKSGWMLIEIPWGESKTKTKFWTKTKWFNFGNSLFKDGSYNFKDGKRSYKVYWMSEK